MRPLIFPASSLDSQSLTSPRLPAPTVFRAVRAPYTTHITNPFLASLSSALSGPLPAVAVSSASDHPGFVAAGTAAVSLGPDASDASASAAAGGEEMGLLKAGVEADAMPPAAPSEAKVAGREAGPTETPASPRVSGEPATPPSSPVPGADCAAMPSPGQPPPLAGKRDKSPEDVWCTPHHHHLSNAPLTSVIEGRRGGEGAEKTFTNH
jgi:hypothetical protein